MICYEGPNPIEFENGYVAYEDLPEDKKRNIIRKEEGNWDDENNFDNIENMSIFGPCRYT